MKFGTHILDKSLPAWKHNIINYQRLKDKIKKCTTRLDEDFHPSCIEDDSELLSLRALFCEQFEMINIFLSMKLREYISRIISIEKYVLELKDVDASPKTSKLIKIIDQHLNECSKELQQLSRYLILQKIAIRKLFKKLIKHYTYSQEVAYSFIDSLKESPQMTKGYEGISLMSVDLDPYLFEVSLIAEIIHEIKNRHRRNSTTQTNEVQFSNSVSMDSSSFPSISSNVTFDQCYLSEYIHLKSFVVSKENEDEIKFLLLTSGFALIEDSVMETTSKLLNNHEGLLKRKNSIRSMASLSELRNTDTSKTNVYNPEKYTSAKTPILPSSPHSRNNIATNEIFLENPSESYNTIFELLSSTRTDCSSNFESTSMNLFPNILVSYPNTNHTLLMCNVGGLRNHISTTSLKYDQIQSVLSGNSLVTLENLLPIDRVCLDWCYAHNYKKLPFDLRTKRTRFMSNKSVDEKRNAECLVCLDDNIRVDNQVLPYAILEIKILRKNNQNFMYKKKGNGDKEFSLLTKICQKFLKDNISVYPLNENLTLWNIAAKFHTGIDPIFILANNGIDSLDDLFKKGACMLEEECMTEGWGNVSVKLDRSLDKFELQKTSHCFKGKPYVRYWNELDGEEDGSNHAFYIDEDYSDSIVHYNAFVKFNPIFIIFMHKILQKLRLVIRSDIINNETSRAIDRPIRSYGSFASTSTLTDNSTTFGSEIGNMGGNDEQISESTYEAEHDEVISFLFLSMIFISAITTGISAGVITSLLGNLKDDTELQNQGLIITVVTVSLTMSLTLSAFSILILFSRYTLGPAWYYFSGISLFLLTIATVCYSLIEIIIL